MTTRWKLSIVEEPFCSDTIVRRRHLYIVWARDLPYLRLWLKTSQRSGTDRISVPLEGETKRQICEMLHFVSQLRGPARLKREALAAHGRDLVRILLPELVPNQQSIFEKDLSEEEIVSGCGVDFESLMSTRF